MEQGGEQGDRGRKARGDGKREGEGRERVNNRKEGQSEGARKRC